MDKLYRMGISEGSMSNANPVEGKELAVEPTHSSVHVVRRAQLHLRNAGQGRSWPGSRTSYWIRPISLTYIKFPGKHPGGICSRWKTILPQSENGPALDVCLLSQDFVRAAEQAIPTPSAGHFVPETHFFYFRYVDDIILAAPSESIHDFFNVFNSLHAFI
ncbi:hypothetical protein ALC57_09595 [Trachymyrmex cornetzi]|uniref:Uncharacterized protein n=1 Tax=Trachymyrmex cornetzi TaxID=471704 RepID=A0A195DZF0_9HYME|nr:hypothetical protein ALC57_09595 [Trachymyrmex cornetzi]